MPRLRILRASNCLPLLDSVVGSAVGTRITDIDKISETARFLIISLRNELLSKTSPFATEKALQGIGGSPKSVKKFKSGDLLIEISSAIQTKYFLLAKIFLNNSVKITIHRTLNSSQGVVSEPQLLHSPEPEIHEGLTSQGVIGVKRINIKRGTSFIATKHIVLTFNPLTPSGPQNLTTFVYGGFVDIWIREMDSAAFSPFLLTVGGRKSTEA
ncbi:hypothetical protein AVEN_240378-1 [Araneus ventricosus]|uniref:Uncharacterized protein n=1 Tax=Araneus ventricosus TaxID=182803 RepID=A0A4Y2F0F0_ARAVE|nr:hypothetical protein AVEN_240378-1 [Araneus ventricosus]